jgi:SulP family sulfate permease
VIVDRNPARALPFRARNGGVLATSAGEEQCTVRPVFGLHPVERDASRMPRRYRNPKDDKRSISFSMAAALRASLRAGYGARDLRSDILAGLVVGIVALPLAMALAIASGVPPQHGLYTAIIAGAMIPLLGGSCTNVSGPTAAFVVLLAPVSAKFGVGGLLIATFMAGVMLVAMGMARLGRFIQFIPYPVTTGFTAGIGVVIATLQLKDFLGLTTGALPEHFPEKVVELASALPTVRWQDLSIGVFTLALLIVWPKVTKKIPGPLIAMALGAVVAWLLAKLVPGFRVDTIGTRFSYTIDGHTFAGIPRTPPHFAWPWEFAGPGGKPMELSLQLVRSLMGPAFAIAALGAIESLLCAVVADGMAGTKHDPDVELAAQGLGNMTAPFFGGIAATGAIARTATNIRAGGRTPIAAFVHALFVLAAVLLLAPLLAYLPMASLAALLLIVAWNMSEARHFVHMVRVAPKSDIMVLLTCFSLTVVFDMTISVSAGIMLAALLFMQRMSQIFEAKLSVEPQPHLADPHMKGVMIYEIAGPLFFGAAEKAIETFTTVRDDTRAIVLQMDAVPVIDITGLVALESALEKLARAHIFVAMAGVRPGPRAVLERAGLRDKPGELAICSDDEDALVMVRMFLGLDERPTMSSLSTQEPAELRR